MICENCNTNHDGSYGSGRFCSTKCARGFSTKEKRTEINKKVSNSLKGRESWVPKEKRGSYIFTNEDRLKGKESRLDSSRKKFILGELKGPETLKKYLIESKGNKCEICGQLPIWNNMPLVLELDHIDGNPENNMPDNLRLICGHCHSQTPTFRGRNNGTGNRSYMKKYYGYRNKT